MSVTKDVPRSGLIRVLRAYHILWTIQRSRTRSHLCSTAVPWGEKWYLRVRTQRP